MSSTIVANQANMVVIDRGAVSNQEYTCTFGNDQSTIKIIKEEGYDLTYKISVLYSGIIQNRPRWNIKINDKTATYNGNPVNWNGSKELAFKAINREVIHMQETDEKGTENVWFKPSEAGCPCYLNLPADAQKIQSLVEKGKLFEPDDGKVVKKLFYNADVGVVLYARDESWNSSIYFGKETEEFVKCEAKMIQNCRCNVGDSVWSVKLPEENRTHNFAFPTGVVTEDGHGSQVLWDGIDLTTVNLQK